MSDDSVVVQLPDGDEPKLPARSGGIFGAVGAMDRAKAAVEREKSAAPASDNGSTAEVTAAIFDQDAKGAGVEESASEPEVPAEDLATPTPDEPKPTEVILTRMTEVSADPDAMDQQLRNNKLLDIKTQVGLLPDDELGKFCAFLVTNGDQFEQRTLHYAVKLLLQRHPKVIEQEPALPGNILGGVARRVIEREYTWETLVIHPPRPKPEPPMEESTSEAGGEASGGDGQASIEEEPPPPEPDPEPVEDPILAELRRQNAELATLGF